jgi:hypothetical protein
MIFSRVPVGNARACHRLPGGSEGPSHRSGVGAHCALSSGRPPVVAAVRRKRTRPMPPDGCLRETGGSGSGRCRDSRGVAHCAQTCRTWPPRSGTGASPCTRGEVIPSVSRCVNTIAARGERCSRTPSGAMRARFRGIVIQNARPRANNSTLHGVVFRKSSRCLARPRLDRFVTK